MPNDEQEERCVKLVTTHKRSYTYSLFSCSDTAIYHKRYLSKTTSVILTQIKRMKFLVFPNSSHSYPLPNACPMSIFQTVISSHQTKENSKKNVLE